MAVQIFLLPETTDSLKVGKQEWYQFSHKAGTKKSASSLTFVLLNDEL